MPTKKTLFVINPAAASGALKAAWGGLADGLKGHIRHFDAAFTRNAGDATRITREALKKKYHMIVSVGGDGTLNECVNGFFDRGKLLSREAVLGILPFGRGSDFARGMGIPSDPAQAMKHLKGTSIKRVDVGVCTFTNDSNKRQTRHFINIANVGIVPRVVEYSRRVPRVAKKMGYAYGAMRGMLGYKALEVIFEGRGYQEKIMLLNMSVANGRYFGAGMRIAPDARVDDGLFDVIAAGKMSVRHFFLNMPKLYSGGLTRLKNVSYFRSDKIEVRSADKKTQVLVEMDGETVGSLPATFTILPRAINFKI